MHSYQIGRTKIVCILDPSMGDHDKHKRAGSLLRRDTLLLLYGAESASIQYYSAFICPYFPVTGITAGSNLLLLQAEVDKWSV